MKAACLVLAIAACGEPANAPVDGAVELDARDGAVIDAPTTTGFGELSGMCGVLNDPELLGASPVIVQDEFTFARAYVDAADRPLLTPGGLRLAETPNAGGSSGLSEVFAYEQLARCELAMLLKTETEIVYTDAGGKKTDFLVEVDGHRIGVSVTRAFAFPIGQPYSQAQAMDLITRKLADVQLATANVTAADAWGKQILSYMAIDDQAAQMVASVWTALDPTVKADTILLITTTSGEDLFIYTND